MFGLGGFDKTIKKPFFYLSIILLILIILVGCIEITPRYPDSSSTDKNPEVPEENEEDDNLPDGGDDGSSDTEPEDTITEVTLSELFSDLNKYKGSKISFNGWFDKFENNVLFIDDHIAEDSYRLRPPDWLTSSYFEPENSNGYNFVAKLYPIYNLYIDLENYKLFDGNDQSAVTLEDILFNPDSYDGKYETVNGIVNIVIYYENKLAITDEKNQFTDVYVNLPDTISHTEFSEDLQYYFTGTIDIDYNAYGYYLKILEITPN